MIEAVTSKPAPIIALSFAEELGRANRIKSQAHALVKTVMQDVRLGRAVELEQVEPMIESITESVLSNSGALLIGTGYDWLKSAVSKIPAGQSLIIDPLRNIEVSLRQSQAQNLAPALATTAPRAPMAPSFIGPGLAAAGLLAAPGVNRP